MYTHDDHVRKPLLFPECNCGAVWRQRGNRTGHCSRCHLTWEGISLFDAHQSTGPDGHTICKAPTEMTVKGEPLRFVDGSWRGPKMSRTALEAFESVDL